MHAVELYAQIRRYVLVDHHSQREAARYFGISRETVTKMIANAQPPGYRRTARPVRPKLGPYLDWITAILTSDKLVHRKQRHTAKRIFERLRDEHGYTGGY